MAYLHTSHSKITAIASCVPAHTERTADYLHISAEEREMFTKTTGIRERRIADKNVTCSDLCYTAAKHLLEKYNCANEIDVIIFVSQSPDYYLPATSILLQERLNLKKDSIAFDISLGCSGYVYGLSVMGNLLQSGQLKKGLLLVGDKSSTSTTYEDKSTYPLFGDAGTATLVEYTKEEHPWHFNLQSDASGKNAIIIEHGQCRNPFDKTLEDMVQIEPGIARAKKHLVLNGMDVFNFALKEVALNINTLLEKSGTDKETIDFFVLHQANKLINESVRKKLKVDAAKVPYSIDVFGNTSSASIPLTMCHAMKEELQSKKMKLLLSGFGVGLSWGSMILETENIYTSLLTHDRP
ncbi:MAG: 3-oxoacyl-ACP synthase III family protein [Bacteroidia bacterium]